MPLVSRARAANTLQTKPKKFTKADYEPTSNFSIPNYENSKEINSMKELMKSASHMSSMSLI
jgi:hypothetical protein